MRFLFARATLLATLTLAGSLARAEIVLTDDSGASVRLPGPARRIVSLAPHITEVLYAAGAGAQIAGTVEYSDYPEAAKALPRVGGYSRVNLEAVVALKPDLVIAWQSGNAAAQVERFKALGLPLFITQPDTLEDVAHSLEQFGRLAGTENVANAAATAYRSRLAAMRKQQPARAPLRVFYEVWKQPLTTIGGRQIISDVLRLCGGINVFADLVGMAPQVSVEAVLAANPEAIVASGMGEERPEWLDDWRRWPQLAAVSRGNLFFVPPGLLQRHTPRLLDGAERVCRQLDEARGRR